MSNSGKKSSKPKPPAATPRPDPPPLPPAPDEFLSAEDIGELTRDDDATAPLAPELVADDAPVRRAQRLGPSGELPEGGEWYANETGPQARGTLGEPHIETVMHDGRVWSSTAPELFPAGMFHDASEPGRVWTARGWELDGVSSPPPVGHLVCGIPGTPFEEYVFVWCSGGIDGGRWARRVK